MAGKIKSLEDLYVEELKDLYSAENQLLKALPKMAKAAVSEELRKGFEEHLEQTKVQVSRLEQIFSEREEKPTGKKCVGMEGLIKEGEEIIEEDMDESVRDAALIAAAQRVEHYEMAGYGTVRAYAELLGETNAAKLLNQTIQEEGKTDKKLTGLAESFANQLAMKNSTGKDEMKSSSTSKSQKSPGGSQSTNDGKSKSPAKNKDLEEHAKVETGEKSSSHPNSEKGRTGKSNMTMDEKNSMGSKSRSGDHTHNTEKETGKSQSSSQKSGTRAS